MDRCVLALLPWILIWKKCDTPANCPLPSPPLMPCTQTDCLGVASFADWEHANGSHPKTFTQQDLTADLALRLRMRHDDGGRPLPGAGSCDVRGAVAAAWQLLHGSSDQHTNGLGELFENGRTPPEPTTDTAHPIPHSTQAPLPDDMVAAWIRDQGYTSPLPYSCSLFARKFAYHDASQPDAPRRHIDVRRAGVSCDACGWGGSRDAYYVLRWYLSCSFGLGLAWWCN
jgi:hypothetical protein